MRQDQNELLTRVGPGTKMGELFRRFWLPALLEEELAEPDGPPKPFRLLGEDLVAFRDSEGRIGVLDAFCAHRRAALAYGRNEECGLRCIYHGWKFDVEGECVDLPSEPPNRRESFRRKVRIKAYKAQAAGGVIWVYMGPEQEAPPPLPSLEWARFPASRRAVIKRFQPCNFAQAIEGGIDSAHISFLHRDHADKAAGLRGENIHAKYSSLCTFPEFSVDETEYGLRIHARRTLDDEPKDYLRVTQFMAPCFQMVPPILVSGETKSNPTYGNVWTPIDDYSTWNWGFCSDIRPLSDEMKAFMGPNGIWGDLDADFRPLQNPENQYEWSKDRQSRENFSGIKGVRNQDAAVVESMGPIVDRSSEHLGHSDTAIMRFRRMMIRMAEDLAHGGEPALPHSPELYNIRAYSALVDKWEPEGTRLQQLELGEPVR